MSPILQPQGTLERQGVQVPIRRDRRQRRLAFSSSCLRPQLWLQLQKQMS